MAIKTFTTGEVLTASDTNTYLNNGGLVYVGGGALATATTLFQGVFTSTYRDYRIIIDAIGTSASADVYLRLLIGSSETTGATANNYWAYRGITTASVSSDTVAGSNAAFFTGVTSVGTYTGIGHSIIDISNPQTANKTIASINSFYLTTAAYSTRNGGCAFDTTAQFDGFAIKSLSAATLTGNVLIYGYRQA
jgi:hypothetical protein